MLLYHDCPVCLLNINKSVGIGELCLTVRVILLSQSNVCILHFFVTALITYTKDFIAAFHLCAIYQRKPLTNSDGRAQANCSTLKPRKTKDKDSHSFHRPEIKGETHKTKCCQKSRAGKNLNNLKKFLRFLSFEGFNVGPTHSHTRYHGHKNTIKKKAIHKV